MFYCDTKHYAYLQIFLFESPTLAKLVISIQLAGQTTFLALIPCWQL